MRLENSAYHALLRVSSAIVACVLVFQSGILSPVTQDLANGTQAYLASAIGIKASVTPTELNRYTAQLSARERELDEREAQAEAREIDVGLRGSDGLPAPTTELTTFLLSIILFILTVLIVLNYVLDYLHTNPLPRESRRKPTAASDQQS